MSRREKWLMEALELIDAYPWSDQLQKLTAKAMVILSNPVDVHLNNSDQEDPQP